MSTLAIVERILRETAVPMSVREIVEKAGETLPTKSKTPDTVVARDLSMDIKKKGDASAFIRTSPGRYTMREIHLGRVAEPRDAADSSTTSVLASALSGHRVGALSARAKTERSEDEALEAQP